VQWEATPPARLVKSALPPAWLPLCVIRSRMAQIDALYTVISSTARGMRLPNGRALEPLQAKCGTGPQWMLV